MEVSVYISLHFVVTEFRACLSANNSFEFVALSL